MGDKRIKDVIHGYISVPENYVTNFVNTPHFQRLRRIEQMSSVRALYPCSRHDRFIHSLGTFYLGTLAVKYLQKNSSGSTLFEGEKKQSYIESFKMACLLHDIGHAPFSHLFEDYFNKNKSTLKALLCKILSASDSELSQDIENSPAPAHHEYLSAIIVATTYENTIRDLNGDAAYVARMITGIKYGNEEKKHKNIFISLLNSGSIDVDKLDYVVRDMSMSGIKSIQVDVERILHNIHIGSGGDELCFGKNALSAIGNVFDVKNYLTQKVFNHHTVKYEQELLKKNVDEVIRSYFPQTKCSTIEEAREYFFTPSTYNPDLLPEKKPIISMLCDDDLVAEIKKNNTSLLAQEWLSRQYRMSPLWKSYSDFCHIFQIKGVNIFINPNNDIRTIKSNIVSVLKDIFSNNSVKTEYMILWAEENNSVIDPEKLYIKMSDTEIIKYKDIQFHAQKPWTDHFFYVFLLKETKNFEEIKSTVITRLQEKFSQMKSEIYSEDISPLIKQLQDKVSQAYPENKQIMEKIAQLKNELNKCASK